MPRFRSLFAAAVAVLAVAACSDLTAPKASLSTFSDVFTVYPLNGAPVNAPNAVLVSSATSVHADAGMAFDLAFGLDSTGKQITLIPVKLIASQLTAVHTVGFQPVLTQYDSLTRAPKSGYKNDTTLVVSPGVTTVIQVSNPLYCYGSLVGTTYYAKMVVDSVDVNRVLHVRLTVDPNCGFYDLTLGVPKS